MINIKILESAGLTGVQAEIYDYLLNNKEAKALEIAKKIKRPRGVVYKGLEELIDLGLAEKNENQGVARFRAEHPSALEKVLAEKEKKMQKEKAELEKRLEREKASVLESLPDLTSLFNLANNKPGVRYFEGEEGLIKVLDDILTSKETVSTFGDIETIIKYMEKLNVEHAKKREELGLKKRIIVTDTEFAKNYLKNYYRGITEFKSINHKAYPMDSIVEIYDGKVAYISLSDKSILSMIISDNNIYRFNKSIFDFTWKRGKAFD